MSTSTQGLPVAFARRRPAVHRSPGPRARELHEHVRGAPLVLPPSGHPARWEGPVASRLAADVTGAPWDTGGATAMRQCWRDHRPRGWPSEGEAFSLYVRPEE
jgi:hypothetical protein